MEAVGCCNTGLTNYIMVFALAISGNNIFAGTNNGVYLSSNNGSNWVNTGLTNESVSTLAINNDTIYAGTDSAGVWKRALSDITGIHELKKENRELKINISPNPVNESSVITYQLPETA